jgi:thioredoxin-related protein
MPKKAAPPILKRRPVWAGVMLLIAVIAAGAFYVWQSKPEVEPQVEEGDDGGGGEEFFFIQAISYPDWFAPSTLNLREDLDNALSQGKRGIALYFSREDCVCCDVMKEVNLERQSIIDYIQRYFNVIAIDVWGHMTVTDFDGTEYTEARFANLRQADATPTMLFFDANGEVIFRLVGYHDNYTFQMVLDYVLGHSDDENFTQYQTYLQQPELFDYFELHDHKQFLSPPYQLDRSQVAGNRPLVVFFERGNCAGCDFLHSQLMTTIEIAKSFQAMDLVQLDITDPTPVVTPDGEVTTSQQWAQELDISYTPTLIFFDESGKQIKRLDSIIGLRHLDKTLEQILKSKTFASSRQ